MDKSSIIKVSNLTKKFKVGDGEFTALHDINLNIEKGEFSGLVGPSGSGKTTLLNLIGALDEPTSGSVNVDGYDISTMSDAEASVIRNHHIGFIFQSYNLIPVYTLYQNVEFPLLLQNRPAAERKKLVEEALDWVGLLGKAKKKPGKVSGGEAQRVAIARAIVKRPQIVLADEPTANLDSANAHGIMKIMKQLNEELDTTFVFASHDSKVIQYLERIVSLEDGKIIKDEQIKK